MNPYDVSIAEANANLDRIMELMNVCGLTPAEAENLVAQDNQKKAQLKKE